MHQHVVQMQRVGDQHAAELGLPFAAPGHGVVFRRRACQKVSTVPTIGLAGDAGVDDALGLLDAVAVAVLEDRHQHALCDLLGCDDRVDVGERAGQRLLADHVLAGAKRRHDLSRCMPGRVQMSMMSMIVVGQQVVEGCGAALDAELVADRVRAAPRRGRRSPRP